MWPPKSGVKILSEKNLRSSCKISTAPGGAAHLSGAGHELVLLWARLIDRMFVVERLQFFCCFYTAAAMPLSLVVELDFHDIKPRLDENAEVAGCPK